MSDARTPHECHNDFVGDDTRRADRTLEIDVRPRDDSAPKRQAPFKQPTRAMGKPRINLDKALAVAARLEDEETIRRLSLGK